MIILSLSKTFVYEEYFFNSVVIPDPCDQSSCGNNGTCEDVWGNATCVCSPEFTGPACEVNIFDGLGGGRVQ